jgi:hypothetical protein
MNFSSYVSVPDYEITLSSIPHVLWQYYLEYLWYYESRSWVARIASVFRILAVMVAAPIVILMLLVRVQVPGAIVPPLSHFI